MFYLHENKRIQYETYIYLSQWLCDRNRRMNETDNSYRTNVNNIGYWFWFSAEQTDCR